MRKDDTSIKAPRYRPDMNLFPKRFKFCSMNYGTPENPYCVSIGWSMSYKVNELSDKIYNPLRGIDKLMVYEEDSKMQKFGVTHNKEGLYEELSSFLNILVNSGQLRIYPNKQELLSFCKDVMENTIKIRWADPIYNKHLRDIGHVLPENIMFAD